MNISCNIIKDLMPSYLDEICSEESRNAVEAHIAACENCKEKLELMKNELTSEKTEQQQLQYMKKVKRHYQTKGIGIWLFILLIVIGYLLSLYYQIQMRVYFVTLPIFIAAAYIVLPKDSTDQKKTKQSTIFIVLSILSGIYSAVLFVSAYKWAVNGEALFGLELYELGPFCVNQFMAVAALQLILLVAATIQKLRGFRISRIIYPLTITAGYMISAFTLLLHRMSDPKSFISVSRKNFLTIIIEGIITTIIIYVIILLKTFRKKSSKCTEN